MSTKIEEAQIMIAPDDTLLRGMAEMAFGMGLVDGKKRSKPRNGENVMGELRLAFHNSEYGCKWLVIHRLKFRQVYGAGFDIAAITKAAK